jgi:glutamine synthetase
MDGVLEIHEQELSDLREHSVKASNRDDVMRICEEQRVRFMRLQFTDLLGCTKNVELPYSQIQKALDGQIMFDGSSIEGFARIEESDMLLEPDPSTFGIYPWRSKAGRGRGRVGRLICDIKNPDESPFNGCPRTVLKRQVARAAKLGYTMMAGPEAEFFLFLKDAAGNATTNTHDSGGYFDLAPIDLGEEARREIVNVLEVMGFEVEAAHHEVATGQHEIDFKYTDAVSTADNLTTFRFVVRKVAQDFGLHATFMPKPLAGENGSGMHCHLSLFKEGDNAFYGKGEENELSPTARHFIGGLLRHARAMVAITNPLVNSYKRLVPGYEAPTHITWSEKNRSPLARVPARRGEGTRVELRMPDPACNPYLALAVMLASGLDGIDQKTDPGPPVNRNIYNMSHRERRRLKIDSLPRSFARPSVITSSTTSSRPRRPSGRNTWPPSTRGRSPAT